MERSCTTSWNKKKRPKDNLHMGQLPTWVPAKKWAGNPIWAAYTVGLEREQSQKMFPTAGAVSPESYHLLCVEGGALHRDTKSILIIHSS